MTSRSNPPKSRTAHGRPPAFVNRRDWLAGAGRLSLMSLAAAALSSSPALIGGGALAAQAVPASDGAPATREPADSRPAPAARPAPASRPEIPLPALGSTIDLPDLVLLDGRTVDAAARQGKTVVLYWWASWCPFCAEQSPLIDRLWRDEADNGLLVLGLSIDRQAKVAADHLKRKGHTFPSAWLSPELGRQLPKPKGLPVTVVLDPAGKVVVAEAGQMFAEDVAELARWAPRRRSSSGE